MKDLRKSVKENETSGYYLKLAVLVFLATATVPSTSKAIEYMEHTYIPIQTVVQEQSLWCWAAAALAIASYYGDDSVEQCEIVNEEKNRTDCCNIPTPESCNLTGDFSTEAAMLEEWGVSASHTNGPLSAWDSGFYLWAEKPFIMGWAWDSGGAHDLVAIGFQAENGVYGTPVFMSFLNPGDGSTGGKWAAFYDWVVDGDGDPDINQGAHEWIHTTYALSPAPDDVLLRRTYEFIDSVWEEAVDDNAWYYYANDELIAQDITVTTKDGDTNPLTEQMMDSCTWYSAGNKITLKPGFGVSNGTCFKAFVD